MLNFQMSDANLDIAKLSSKKLSHNTQETFFKAAFKADVPIELPILYAVLQAK